MAGQAVGFTGRATSSTGPHWGHPGGCPNVKGTIVKDKLIFAAEVLAVFAIAYAVQKHVFKVPVVGAYLPGGQ